mmetsp:Transcript_6677/g.26770  ORF Transcript_6677/g.26770 Transcript_6677/m.26770 type:complete len:248 (-) Transcript_6677:1227-1970(-)
MLSRNGPPYAASRFNQGVGSIGALFRAQLGRDFLGDDRSSSSSSAFFVVASPPLVRRLASVSSSLDPSLVALSRSPLSDASPTAPHESSSSESLSLSLSLAALSRLAPSSRPLRMNPQFAGVSAPTTRPTNPRSRVPLSRSPSPSRSLSLSLVSVASLVVPLVPVAVPLELSDAVDDADARRRIDTQRADAERAGQSHRDENSRRRRAERRRERADGDPGRGDVQVERTGRDAAGRGRGGGEGDVDE